MTGIVLAGTGMGALVGPPLASRLIYIYEWRTSYIIIGIIVLVIVVIAAQFLKRDPTQIGQLPYGEDKSATQQLSSGVTGFSLKEAVYTTQFWLFFGMLFCFGFIMFTVVVHIVPHATDIGVSATSAANVLATIGGLVIIGRVVMGGAGDRIGSRQVFIIGFILLSAAFFLLIPARTMLMLCLFAVVYGFAQGGMGSSESPMVANLFGLKAHGLIFGVVGIGFTLGGTISPFLAGYIFDVYGNYHIAFLVCAALGIVGLISTIVLKPIKDKYGQSKASLRL